MSKNDSFFITAQPGDIIGIRTEGWIGRLIRWVTSSNVNHVGMYIGSKLMIESTLGYGVRILPVETYLGDSQYEVSLYRIKQKFDPEKIIEFSYNFYGTKYDLLGQTGILLKYMTKKTRLTKLVTFWGKNRAVDSGVFCSQFMGDVFAMIPWRFADEDNSYLTPSEVCNSCEKVDY